ncbi:MAG: phosphomannomutase/phosphoglucomutase, partial [Candidatus Azambacteria bacterium]|nr:phosphomannomutase/phosphoglucomutase [Candidatus Azambacteria bacterium]
PRVVYDIRFSRGVKEKFQEWGIKAFPSRVGRAFLRDNAVHYKADISGELSGHIFFKKANYNEMPFLAMLKILKIMAKSGRSINELAEPFKTWFNSGEINIPIAKMPIAMGILAELKKKYQDGKIDELDGLTVEYDDPANSGTSWWFNLRPSNTEPVVRLVVEAKNKDLLEQKVAEIKKLVL